MRIKDGAYVTGDNLKPANIGYYVHAHKTKEALVNKGVNFVNDDYDLVLHQCPSHVFKKIGNKPNVLFTAYEAPDLPKEYTERLADVDLLITTSVFVKNIYRKYYKGRIEVCNLGVDTDVFRYKKRKKESDFVFLWVGAPDPRKGVELIEEAWTKFNSNGSYLYLKTTGQNRVNYIGNKIVDSRALTPSQLEDVYHTANCFIFPSYSEGFGLPLAEAMATGLPCIFTPYSGMKDFANKKNAYPLKFDMVDVKYKIDTKAARGSVLDLVEKMEYIKNNYDRALVKGKNAYRNIRDGFTWSHTGTKMKSILEDFLNGFNNKRTG